MQVCSRWEHWHPKQTPLWGGESQSKHVRDRGGSTILAAAHKVRTVELYGSIVMQVDTILTHMLKAWLECGSSSSAVPMLGFCSELGVGGAGLWKECDVRRNCAQCNGRVTGPVTEPLYS